MRRVQGESVLQAGLADPQVAPDLGGAQAMANRYAFMRRSTFVCATCYNYRVEGGLPYCGDDRIRYDPGRFGCSSYGSSDAEDTWVPLPPEVRQMTLKRWS